MMLVHEMRTTLVYYFLWWWRSPTLIKLQQCLKTQLQHHFWISACYIIWLCTLPIKDIVLSEAMAGSLILNDLVNTCVVLSYSKHLKQLL